MTQNTHLDADTPLESKHPSFPVSAAREKLPTLVLGVDEHPGLVVRVTRRNNPAALLVSERQYGLVIDGMESGQLKPVLAVLVAMKWLGSKDAPSHLFKPQVDELMNLEEEQLLELRKIDPAALSETERSVADIEDEVIQRLSKRRDICLAIMKAHKEDLYDVSEHITGSMEP